MSSKHRCVFLIILFLCTLLVVGGLTVIVDPFFHYHAPLPFLTYPIDNQRYQNDGIVKHFPYNAIITGTSMTENFKSSEFDALFGVSSVKTCFSGATLKETGNHLVRALDANPEIRCILRGIDGWSLLDDKDHMRTDAVYPDYLYDDNLINDVEYIFNKEILFNYTLEAVKHTLKGFPTTNFDSYSSWDTSETGRERLLSIYQRPEASTSTALSAESLENLKESIDQNVLSAVRAHPNVHFYLFFSPYSIYYMDEQNQRGILQQQFECFQAATEMLLEYENIHLFCFFDDYALVTNPDNYTDVTHYTAQINSLLLQRMASGEYQLTKENYAQRWKEITDFYTSYDFKSLFS